VLERLGVSKAFTDEDAVGPDAVVPPRAPLPAGVPNYVTERGLAQLRVELVALLAERAGAERDLDGADRTYALSSLAERRARLEERIASAEVVTPPTRSSGAVRFGATVSLRGPNGVRRYQIVGVDEADAAHGRIAFVSPLARALLGRSEGETVQLRTPRGDEAWEITGVGYEEESRAT
jgi:transcription elongation factor GreB